MKKIWKYALLATAVVATVLVAINLSRPGTFAATTPSLGAAATYGVLANTYTNSAAGTTINGDVGFTVGPTVEPDPIGGHTNYGNGSPYTTAGVDQSSAASALSSQACTTTFSAAVDLFSDTTHGTPGVYTPGVYCVNGAITVSGSLTFNGSGTYIFRSVGALDTTAGITITLTGGASACDIFWTPGGDTTLGANTGFKGTAINSGAITIGANTVWLGRALAFNGAVTSGANSSITVPACAPPPATLRVVKQVINNSGGAATASSFNMRVKLSGTDVVGSPAAGTAAPGTSYSLAPDTYVVSEDANAAYSQSFSGDCDSAGSVTLASGEDKTCTITNNDIPPTLRVVKQVVNNSGGTAVAADFNLHVKSSGVDVAGSPAAGIASPGTSYSPSAGAYTVSEDAHSGYTTTFSGDCDANGAITLALAADATCTITNDDIAPVPATLHVVKAVTNNSGGTATASNFSMHVKLSGTDVTGSPAIGAAAPGTAYSLSPGTYTINEDGSTAYTQTFSGDCDASGNVVLAPGDNKTCTVTNDDIPATLTVVKVVVNDSDGTKTVADFPLFVSGTPVTSGVPNTFSVPGNYTVTETADPDYTQTFSGDCDASGNLSLSPGDNKTCTVTNDDSGAAVFILSVPPLISVVKVPNDLTLPSGSSTVTYNYELSNLGTATITDVALNDDSCSSVNYASGDVNGNDQLEANETWNYTCTATLNATHTNNVVATGLANDITATDIASATVVVESTLVPPLIHVVKIPSKLNTAAREDVTYTLKITNPGIVPLSDVTLTDGGCTGLAYVSGDTNSDANLDPTEIWMYTCRANIAQTTTNTATATGRANNLTAKDSAFATVVVAAASPGFPNTGLAPQPYSKWEVIIPVSIAALLVLLCLARGRLHRLKN